MSAWGEEGSSRGAEGSLMESRAHGGTLPEEHRWGGELSEANEGKVSEREAVSQAWLLEWI